MKYIFLLLTTSLLFLGCSTSTPKIQKQVKEIQKAHIMVGEYSYKADSATFKECKTEKVYPVAFEDAHASLEIAFLNNKERKRGFLKVEIVGEIVLRKRVDSSSLEPTLIVKKFLKPLVKERCKTNASLEGTYWKLISVEGVKVSWKSQKREPHLIFRSDGKFKAFTGCNSVSTKYKKEGQKISLVRPMMMSRMFCPKAGESDFISALKKMYKYKIEGNSLEIFSVNGDKLAYFEPVYFY